MASARRSSIRFSILALILLGSWKALAQVSPADPYQPAAELRLDPVERQLVLRYHVPQLTGAIMVYRSWALRSSPQPLTNLTAEVPLDGFGQCILPRSSSSAFFRLLMVTNPVPRQMVWIPPGSFLMGSALDEPERSADEGPQHLVTITNGFWLCNFDVTQAEYRTLMGADPSQGQAGPTSPVDSVTWFEATNYCARLTAREAAAGRLTGGLVYRLPTEAEWEYACRAGTQTAFSFGPDASQINDYAWWSEDAGSSSHPVGMKNPNPWALYDMHGNVFEWCADVYAAYPGAVTRTRVGCRVLRGGSWYCPTRVLRSACRDHSSEPASVSSLVGFRVALGVPIASAN